jgi:hypothetical protein
MSVENHCCSQRSWCKVSETVTQTKNRRDEIKASGLRSSITAAPLMHRKRLMMRGTRAATKSIKIDLPSPTASAGRQSAKIVHRLRRVELARFPVRSSLPSRLYLHLGNPFSSIPGFLITRLRRID